MNQSQIIAGKPVAVIGAGVSGLVAAKRLAAEGFQVSVYERRSQAGGLWNFSPDPNAPFASAVYGDLQTNFPRQLMELQDYPWTSQPLFMQHNLVQGYLAGYAQDIQQKCNSRVRFHFNTEIVRLYHEAYSGGHWELTWESVLTGESGTSQFLYVIVAVGLYDEPTIPHYKGLATWRKFWRNSVSHAKSYRSPDAFRGKNVLIVGYQASGFDIANKISTSVSKLWISSTRPLAGGLPANALPMKGVSRFISSPRWVIFTDGQTLFDVDHIIFCTGYQYHQPFIKKNRTTAEPLFPSGSSIKRLHEHTIYIDIPTLAFLGMVRDAVPTFLIVQAQAAFVSRFFADQLRSLRQRNEDSQHRLPYPLFMDYLLRLESLCEQSDNSQALSVSRYTNPVFRWTCELDLLRTKRREIRDEFLAQPPTTTRIWSTEDMIHRYHCKFLSVRHNIESDIQILLPFLVLSYGYNGEHGNNSTLPFQGWRRHLGTDLHRSLLESAQDLDSQLGPGASDVIVRGRSTLYVLLRDRWAEFCHGLPNGHSRDEEEGQLRAFALYCGKEAFSDGEISDDDVLTVADMSDMECT